MGKRRKWTRYLHFKKLSKIFSCSLDCLLSNEEDNKEVSETKEESKEVPVNKETIVIHQKEIHTCAKCGKNVSEEELVSEDDTKTERYGSATRSVSVAQTYYHKKMFITNQNRKSKTRGDC